MKRISINILILIALIINMGTCLAQEDWEQKLDGWVDDIYYPYLFLGGSFYTRISFADIDNDGDLDLFYGGGDSGSLVYFENVGNINNPLFEFRNEEFPGLTNWENEYYGGTVDVDFADLDDDSDLDAAYAKGIEFGGAIRWNDGTPEIRDFTYRSPRGPGDGQSNVTLVDIDNDGDYDYFSGQGYRQHQLYFAENYGTPEVPYFLYQGDTTHYQGLDFGVPFNFDMGDLDGDGDYDLIVCKHPGPVAYYENTGTPDSAYFTHITDDFLPGRDTTDWMETPELADIDGDGDLDLFLAGGYAHLYYFENQGSSESPNFIQQYDTSFFYVQHYTAGAWLGNSADIDGDGDDDIAPGRDLFINESANNEIRFARYENMIPFITGSFADMDDDNDYDYVAPAGIGTIIYYENSGDSSWPEWEDGYSLFVDNRLHYPFTVAVGDLDNDGDFDVLIGHDNSTRIDYYRNDGTSQEWDFNYIGNLELPQWEFRGHFNVLLEDIDNDNDLDLLIGDNRSGHDVPIRLIFYRNDGTPEEPVWTFITDDFQNVVSQHRNGSIAPCLADIDKDGDKDLVMTNNSLGMQLFINPMIHTNIPDDQSDSRHPIRNTLFNSKTYPNPFNQSITFQFDLIQPTEIEINIYNILGQKVDSVLISGSQSGDNYFIWNAGNLPSGVYFYKILTNNAENHGKVILLK